QDAGRDVHEPDDQTTAPTIALTASNRSATITALRMRFSPISGTSILGVRLPTSACRRTARSASEQGPAHLGSLGGPAGGACRRAAAGPAPAPLVSMSSAWARVPSRTRPVFSDG